MGKNKHTQPFALAASQQTWQAPWQMIFLDVTQEASVNPSLPFFNVSISGD